MSKTWRGRLLGLTVWARETMPDLDEIRDVVRVYCGDGVRSGVAYSGLGAFVSRDPASDYPLKSDPRRGRPRQPTPPPLPAGFVEDAQRSAAAIIAAAAARATRRDRRPTAEPFMVVRYAPLFRFDYCNGPRYVFVQTTARTAAGAVAYAAVSQRFARPDQRTAYWVERRGQPATLDVEDDYRLEPMKGNADGD